LFLLFSGILWSNGDHWKHIRKFATHALKDIAFHRSHLEENILEESDFFISSICGKDNIRMDKLMPKAVSNIISNLVFAQRLQLSGFYIFLFGEYLMKIIPETRRAH
jgi:hypothetical protein